MDKSELLSGLILELRRGTIVLCVLSSLQKPTYGYSLITALADSHIAVEANTLYPLLRRLESQGLLTSAWETSTNKPRKYYSTTDLGNEVLRELKNQWQKSVESVTNILERTL